MLGMSIALFILFGLFYLYIQKNHFELSLYHAFDDNCWNVVWAIYTVLGKNLLSSLYNTMDNFRKGSCFVGLFYILFSPKILFLMKKVYF